MGVGMAWYGTTIWGNERDAKRMYKYHRYVLIFMFFPADYADYPGTYC